jgi:hypothetical protein
MSSIESGFLCKAACMATVPRPASRPLEQNIHNSSAAAFTMLAVPFLGN